MVNWELLLKWNSQVYFKSRLSLIVRVKVVLNRTVVVDSDWRFDNLRGSHLQSQSELYHVSWWYYTLVIDLIGQLRCDVIGRLSVKPWCYWLWRLVISNWCVSIRLLLVKLSVLQSWNDSWVQTFHSQVNVVEENKWAAVKNKGHQDVNQTPGTSSVNGGAGLLAPSPTLITGVEKVMMYFPPNVTPSPKNKKNIFK